MTGRRRGAAAAPRGAARETRQSRRTTRSQTGQHAVPIVYRELLAEAGIIGAATSEDGPERPLKRPRTGRRPPALATEAAAAKAPPTQDGGDNDNTPVEAADESDEDDIDLVDVVISEPRVQTIELSSEDESDGEDDEMEFEDVDIDAIVSKQEPADADTGPLQLNLTAAEQALAPSKRNRKQPLTKEEKQRRVEIHQMHLLCLLAHVEKRNHWCNDAVVQATLCPLLSDKTIRFLNPPASLNQFGQTESVKRGLKEAQDVFRHKFRITESGLRRALWAEDKADLQHYERPRNLDSCLDKVDFRKAAQQLKGSRDVAAQLFCALLRAVGVEARLVCSLQPLSFVPGGPTLAKPQKHKIPTKQASALSSPAIPSPRARLGHPHAASYRMPHIPAAPPPPLAPMSLSGPGLVLQESPFPVYWTEVLDVGHQKWQPVDAIVTGLHFRPHRLEPPALDRHNILTYVVAFEDDGTAKDVTRRYAKAINSKTRRLRIDGPLVPSSVEGAKWWRRALRRYRPSRVGPLNDLDQIEEAELTAAEAHEPMPRNVADFKDHPVYALERHLRRHEVLIPGARVVGTVGAGSKGPLEKIYRRKDVRLARTREKWYRVGRIIKPGEEPVKVVPKRKPAKSTRRLHFQARNSERANHSSSDDDDEEDPVLGYNPAKGNPLYTFDQTDLYVPPMVVGGRIPKNVYGNVDVYVPSMVPIGGVHIKHPRAAHAAIILGVDYAPALQGFEFKGRSGTAVYNGVVVPAEAAEGMRVVLKGLEDWEEEVKRQEKRLRVLEKWRDWERTLRIRKRLFSDDTEDIEGHWDGLALSQFVKEGEVGGDSILESEDDEDVPRGYGAVVLNEDGGDDDDDNDDDDDDDDDDVGDEGGGGFEPGGFESGGFGPGGFEGSHHEAGASYSFSGGFEVEDQDEELDSVPFASGNPIQEDVRASTAKVGLSNTNSAQAKGQVEAAAEEEQSEAIYSPRTMRENDTVPLGSITQAIETTITDGEYGQQVQETNEKGDDVSMEEAPVASPKSTLPQEHVGSQKDTEMDEDGASETTEELFMDEDGALLE